MPTDAVITVRLGMVIVHEMQPTDLDLRGAKLRRAGAGLSLWDGPRQ